MSSRREIVVAVEYPWIDPEFPDPVEDAPLIPVANELKAQGITLAGATPDLKTWWNARYERLRAQQQQPAE
jgi:hypothetical protein